MGGSSRLAWLRWLVVLLTACGGGGEASGLAPQIATFSAAPTSIEPGVPTQITWTWGYASDADDASCTIDGVGAVASGDASELTLTADTTFTLRCANAHGEDTADATVAVAAVVRAPVLASFTSSPSTAVIGIATDVTWTWAFAPSPGPIPTCTIDQGIGAVTSGAVSSLTLASDTTFTLTCTNSAGSDSRAVTMLTVPVPVAPTLATFVATPSNAVSGTPTDVTFTWTYANSPTPAPACTIDQSIGAITSGTMRTLTLTAATTYTLTCSNSAGMASRTATVFTTAAPVAPVIATLTATPATVTIGAPTLVRWAWTYTGSPTPNPTCVIDQGIGSISNGFQAYVTLAQTTTFTLTCTNSAGTDSETVVITATPPVAPDLVTFTASPSAVPIGASTSVTWSWTYATPPGPTPTCTISPGIFGNVANGDARSVIQNVATTYTLTCSNSAGMDTAQVTIGVTGCGPAGATSGWVDTIGRAPGNIPRNATAVWIGSGLFVYDGGDYNTTRTGAIWDRATRTWTAINLTGAPQSIEQFGLAWTGSKVVLWGGAETSGVINTVSAGHLYDPVTNTWSTMSSVGAPTARHSPIMNWTGTHISVFDGNPSVSYDGTTGYLNGGLWDPVTNTWSAQPISTTPRGPGTRAVWAQTGLFAFGGIFDFDSTQGGRYHFWEPPSTTWPAGCALGGGTRRFGSVVWTGTRAIVWGGQYAITGGPYEGTGISILPNAAVCTAASIATLGAPAPRSKHTAVWSGSQMLVFGGATQGTGAQTFSDGASYDPLLDQWSPLLAGSPGARVNHQAFWTGTEMVIWGGNPSTFGGTPFGGCIYKP